MAKDVPGTSLRAAARADSSDADLDFLRDACATGVDGQAVAAAADAGLAAGAVSHREPLWTIRGDDAGALRNRVPGIGRWTKLARLSLPLQATRSQQAAGNLRALSAAVRLEFVVCLAEFVAPGTDRSAHGTEFAAWGCRCAVAFCRHSVPACSATAGTRGDLAILVHHAS